MPYRPDPPRRCHDRHKIESWAGSHHKWEPSGVYVRGGRQWQCKNCNMVVDKFDISPHWYQGPSFYDLEEEDWGCPGYDMLQYKQDQASVREVMEL